jgi:colicin import membrane protein
MEVAHGTVVIDVDDTGARAQLRALQAEVQRAMERLDGKEAELRLDANTKEFYAKVRKAQADLEKWEAAKAEATLDVDARKANAGIANAKRRLQEYEKTNVKVYNRINQLDRDRTTLVQRNQAKQASIVEAAERRKSAAVEKESRAATAAANKAERERTQAAAKELRERDRAERSAQRASVQRERELSRERVSAAKAAEQARMAPAKFASELAQVARMRKQYADLGRELDKLNRQSGRLRIRAQPAVHQRVELDQARALAEMASLKAKLMALGHEPPVDIEVGIDAHKAGAIGRMLDSIATTTVRIGPFTTTIVGLARAMALLGPIVVGLVGQFGALAAVASSALVGAFGVASAAATGFLAAAAGIFLVVKPIVGEFQDVKKATDALATATQKYGEHSEQVRKAQSRLSHVLGDVSPQVRRQVEELPKLSGRWRELTKAARPEVWRVIGSGIQTASDLMPLFARNTVDATKAVGRGLREWMAGLRSTEGRTVLGDIFGGFTRAIPNILHGLGQLGAAFGRFMAPFARLMPSLTGGFDRWATGISNASRNASKMQAIAERTVAAMQSLGHVTAAAGRVIAAFVRAGTGPGTSMLESWAKGLNNLAASMNTVAGQRNLTQFFEQSISTANKFWGALKPLAQLFFEWTTILRPFTDVALQVVRVMADITQAIAGLGAAKTTMQVIFGGFLLAGFVRRVREGIVAVRGLATALLGLRAAQAVAGGAGAGGLASMLGGAGAGAGAGAATKQVGALRAAATKLIPAIAGMGAIAGGAATLGLAALAGAAVYGVYKLVTMKSSAEKLRDTLKQVTEESNNGEDATRAWGDATVQGAVAARDYEKTVNSVAGLKKKLNDLDSQGKRNTDEYRNATDRLRQALVQRGVNEDNARKLSAKALALGVQSIASNRARLTATQGLNRAQDNLALAERHANAQRLTGIAREKALSDERRDLAKATRVAAEADAAAERNMNRHAAAQSSVARALKGMIPLTEQATQSIGRLARSRPAAAVKIATKFEDPKDAGRVAQQAQRALGSGVKIKTVMQIIADSRNADQAVARLKGVRIGNKTFDIVERGGSAAVRKIEQIIGKKISPKDARIIERGGDAALRKMAQLTGVKIPSKRFAVTAAASQALAQLNMVRAGLSSIQSKSITVSVTKIERSFSSRAPGAGHASGRGPTTRATALVGEGGRDEMLANRRTGVITRTNGPALRELSADDYVIPTEPKYAQRGRDLFAKFARDMGIPGFKIGKAPPRTAATSANQKRASKMYAKKDVKNKGAYTEINEVRRLQQAEADQSAKISVAESRLKEPDSFIDRVGTDADGNDIFQINQGRINDWAAQLGGIKDMYSALLTIVRQLQTAVQKAINAVRRTVTQSNHNINALNKLETHEKNIISNANGGKKPSKAAVANAKQRLKWLEQEENRQRTIRSFAQESEEDLLQEQQFAGGVGVKGADGQRIQDILTKIGEYETDMRGVQAMAGEQLGAANPKPARPGEAGVTDPFAAGNLRVQQLEAEQALTAIGQGSGRTPQQITADLITAQQGIIGTAQGLLSDADPLNDSAAYSAIQGAAGAIGSLQGTLPNLAAEAQTLGGARGELYKSLGSNVNNMLTSQPFSPVSGTPTGQYPAAGQGNVVNVTNYYQTQPTDPHTWSRNVLFELQAAG